MNKTGIGPLTGYRVLDFTGFESGTVATETLAWFGAEVWKIERPGLGDVSRVDRDKPGRDSMGFIILNMNKKSITCNAKTPEGKELIREMIAKCDVIAENMGPGSMDRLGFSYEECKKINPGIIYASIKGFGQDGPLKDAPAFNPIAAATGGLPAVNGEPDGMPMQCGINTADSTSGYILAMGVIAALLQRERTGVGQRVDVAMQDVVIALGRSNWEPYYRLGHAPRRPGNGMPLEDVAPCDMYPCKGGGKNDYVYIYCSRHPGSNHFSNLCKLIGHEEMLEDERYATPRLRYVNRATMNPLIAEWTMQYEKNEAMKLLCDADIPAGAVWDCDDITKNDYLVEHGIMIETSHEDHGTFRIPGLAAMLSENHVPYKIAERLGESNEYVYKEVLHKTDEELANLKSAKAI